MSDRVYADAHSEDEKAVAAIVMARRKKSRTSCWEWANTAARHAERIGINNARELLGSSPFPDLNALEASIRVKQKSNLLIVTRHKGLVDWLGRRGYTGKVIPRATPSDVLNKHVIGKLPIHLAAIAASVTNVNIPGVPERNWGDELTADDLDGYCAFLRTYIVKEINSLEPIGD